MVQCPRE
jgi:hypothetical protein